MTAFDFDPSIRVVFGAGCLAELGDRAAGLGARRVFLVSDPGIADTGMVERARDILEAAGIPAVPFTDVRENPTESDVAKAADAAREARVDAIVGLGGGSAMDVAKGVNFLVTNGGRMADYQGFGKATKPMLPSIGIPTTAGTGSEAQSYALISHDETHAKMACGDRKARFDVVMLDPDLAGSAPQSVRASAGYDAVAHAVESYACTKANAVSRMYAREAFRLIDGSLEGFVRDGTGAADCLLGAHFAGMAIETSMLGAAHACANALTAAHGTTHGIAVGVMLPAVVAYNAAGDVDPYVGFTERKDLFGRLASLRSAVGLPAGVEALGVSRSEFVSLAEEAAKQWTGTFNPRPIDAETCVALYEAAY